jgi:dolichol-phosphate mannosyltransferase
MNKGIIIIPTYNEIENIDIILKKTFSLDLGLDVLIVDDNSPDKTFQKVQDIIDSNIYNNQLNLVIRSNKEGLAKAYIEGFNWALSKEYKYIIEMDADLSHDPKYIKSFMENIQENDLIIGSRYVNGGGTAHWSLSRKLMSIFGSFYSRSVLGTNIQDMTGGFKCFKREVLEAIDLNNLITTGYAFQIEMNYRTFVMGFKIKEVPIIFEDRVIGKSKMSSKILIEALLKVIVLRTHKNQIQQGY